MTKTILSPGNEPLAVGTTVAHGFGSGVVVEQRAYRHYLVRFADGREVELHHSAVHPQPAPATKRKLTYTGPRGRVLHFADVQEGRRSGANLCGTFGFVHPEYDRPDSGPATLQAMFVPMCKRCERLAEQGR